ncbi:MAG: beta-1,6-glucan synthase [Rhizobiales bacterium 32-66-8]|nr:MAG: beta-1,6-glucan synthase [Rhizobiales bacterium 32-66-8]
MPFSPRVPILFCVAVLAGVCAFWGWMGLPVQMPPSPLAAGEKLPCVSYAPFREGQSPLNRAVTIPEAQIDEDLAQLAKITGCVRTYSVELGLDKVVPLARKHGLKVFQGIWLGSNPAQNRAEIDAGVALAQKYPDTISALVVGNEVMLRGELSAADISTILRDVKARVGAVPVTYADVWEFWERSKALANDVDFVTVHILPYWEDMPVSAKESAAHIDRIRQHVADQFPGKEILIGETGWPSAGRMREAALPSLSEQALVMHEVLKLAKEKGYRVNVIEAYDQPWKRRNEGTVGGHWGIIDAGDRAEKFTWGQPVRNHPAWIARVPALRDWIAVSCLALAGGMTFGSTLAAMPLESLGWVGWTRSSGFLIVSLAASLVGGAVMGAGLALPSVSLVLHGDRRRAAPWLASAASAVLALGLLAAGEAALELIFDPRYKDFPIYALTPVAVALAALALLRRPDGAGAGLAETAGFCVLLAGAIYVPLNETLQNWQGVWFGVLCLVLAVTLWRVRAAPARG